MRRGCWRRIWLCCDADSVSEGVEDRVDKYVCCDESSAMMTASDLVFVVTKTSRCVLPLLRFL